MSGWRAHTTEHDGPDVHVWPADDAIEHHLEGDGCVCGPDVEYVHPDTGESYAVPLVRHHSLDGRELNEPSQ